MRSKVEVVEDNFLALDTQLPDTAWGGGAGAASMGGGVPGGLPSPIPHPAALAQAPRGSASQPASQGLEGHGGRGGLTYEAAAQPCLGDGAVVRVATQVELLVEVQALELALGSGEAGGGGQGLGRGGKGAGNGVGDWWGLT